MNEPRKPSAVVWRTCVTTLCATAVAVLSALLVVRSFFRPVRAVVQLPPQVYDALFGPEDDANAIVNGTTLWFEKIGHEPADVSAGHPGSFFERLTGTINLPVAFFFVEESVPIVQDRHCDTALRWSYALRTRLLLPTVPADFADEMSPANSLLSPTLSIHFAEPDSLAEGSRALPVDGQYAGQEGYALEQTTLLVCTVLVPRYAESVKAWCESVFVPDENAPVTNFSDTSHHESEPSAGDAPLSQGKIGSGAILADLAELQRHEPAQPVQDEEGAGAFVKKVRVQDGNARTGGPVFVASVGDVMVGRGVQERLLFDEGGLDAVFTTTLPVLRRNHITIGNLEGVVTDSLSNAVKTYTFRFKKAVLPVLLRAGFTYLMQANNHCYDYGEPGFKDTLAAFNEYRIPSSGVGYNRKEAEKFYHTTVNGQQFAIISCGAFPVERSGFNGKVSATATETRAGILWQSPELVEQVRLEKASGCFVIVNVHGGEEYRFTPTKSQRAFYEQLCDAGADVVFGSHPHVLQPTEWYHGKLIVYSQGNFLFNGMEDMPGATDSEIVRLGIIGGKIVYVEQYPAILNGTTVSLK